MDIVLTQTNASSPLWRLSGTAIARPTTAASQGDFVNFYMASPYFLDGMYDSRTAELNVRMVTQSDLLSAMTMTVKASHGTLSLPVMMPSICLDPCLYYSVVLTMTA
jgi:hypothetical protein